MITLAKLFNLSRNTLSGNTLSRTTESNKYILNNEDINLIKTIKKKLPTYLNDDDNDNDNNIKLIGLMNIIENKLSTHKSNDIYEDTDNDYGYHMVMNKDNNRLQVIIKKMIMVMMIMINVKLL
jgi:hypothetical protein